ncbi:MAG: hypothetical protein EAZ51_03130 [Sphingobacteriales bacterium]|nr:MAG: hypothetical protein EAZ64_05820 [Sphingobacteriales bacterium]TAF82101.1 MAG: hypothetical protein EAZ51_03130 [Sphingobacteriales bacterium]
MNLTALFDTIISQPSIHAKWLNTLSFMENAGARKISASEDKQNVNLIILKHAAEEHRHAYYLKKQLAKLGENICPTYHNQFLLSPAHSKYYLAALDIMVCKYLKKQLGLSGAELKFTAYLLVTYAIEVRADELYPIYQQALNKTQSKVTVKSIILEEEGHLDEMLTQLKNFSPKWESHAAEAVSFENILFNNWVVALTNEVL